VNIAQRLGVSHATVVKAVAQLQREGLVSSEPYRSIFLTEKGSDLAKRVRHRHQVVYAFLRAIGISEATAQRDAEGIELHVSAETLGAFEQVIQAKEKPG